MLRFRLTSIRLGVLGLALIPLIFLFGVVGVFAWLEADTQAAAAWAQHSDDVLEQSNLLETHLDDADASVRRYLNSGTPASTAEFDAAVALILKDSQHLETLVGDNPSQLDFARHISEYAARRTKDLTKLMEAMRHGDRHAVYNAQIANELKHPQNEDPKDQIRAEIAQFGTAENRLQTQRRASTQSLWSIWRWLLAGATLGGIIVAVTVGLTFGRRIVLRLRRLREQARAFAADETVEAAISGDDEIADVSHTVHDMALRVRERNDALARYRLLAQGANDAILFLRRRDARILEANRAAIEMYGYTLDELLQLTGHDLRTPEADALVGEQIPETGEFNLTLETEHQRRDGTTFPVDVAMQSANLNGEYMVLSVIRDISLRREADNAIRAALAQATEASRLKSEFVAMMSHEIRTPMNGVIGMTELLLDSNLDNEQREFAMTARDSAHSLLGVINNILDFSKIEAGKVETEITEFDLISKVESIASMMGPQSHKKGISLMTYVDPTIPPRLLGDALRLRQVLVNLAGNAVKFTSEGGVSLVVDPIAMGEDSVRLRFAVRDTGIGIAPDVLPRLFKAFSQADGSTTRRYGGTGLGLAISRQLVEIMGGTLDVESTPGRGSTFSFTLAFRIAAPHDLSARRQLHDLRVIIVDDDVVSRDILSRYCSSWGMRTSVAETADEALVMMTEAARMNEPYGIAIIDFRMPGVDGLELGRRIKKLDEISNTALLLITAYDASGQGQDAIEAGFAAYLGKPIRQSQLYDSLLDAVLGTSSSHERTPRRAETIAHHSDRILLVEDNEINRQVFMRQLERLGYGAQFAEDGRVALERATRENFDLIFMDCQMPVMDGFQATRAIRKTESRTGKHVPIIAMTANALAGDRDECISAGMDDYLSKPVAMSDVGRILARWLPDYSSETAPTILDRQRMEQIFGDDAQGLREFFISAIATIRDRCDRLAATTNRHDARELAHEIKGTAANIGAMELADAAQAYGRDLVNSEDLPSSSAVIAACSRLAAAIESEDKGTAS